MTRPRRSYAASAIRDAGHCPNCGKVRYLSRKDARRLARSLSRTDLNAYECDGYWHLGHLATVIRRGRAPRPTREDL